MCLGNSPSGLAACSTFGKKVFFPFILVFIIDTKNGLAPVLNYAHHKGAVLTLAMQDNIVYSCGEDRRIVAVDIRNSSRPVSGLWSMDYVRSICFRNNHLICGTHLGMISVLDPDTLNVCSRFQVSNGVRQVIHSGGAILEISRDRTFKVIHEHTEVKAMLMMKETRVLEILVLSAVDSASWAGTGVGGVAR
ncbi:unnamed protein product [Heligmosomoides polygyrus]|uniref:WD_REPEATS_REGION domain-containing protein n=1 Tax=Heligmosomoides polygyrus TaxID=6339 RepID=A0A3P8AB10_HELPZ|nr:unnamed protein product [Heligmosomoides polygyrus]